MGFEFFKNRPKSFPIQVNEKARLGLWTVRVGGAEKFFLQRDVCKPTILTLEQQFLKTNRSWLFNVEAFEWQGVIKLK